MEKNDFPLDNYLMAAADHHDYPILRPSCHRECPSYIYYTEKLEDGSTIEHKGWCACNGYSAHMAACTGHTLSENQKSDYWKGHHSSSTGWSGTKYSELCRCSEFNHRDEHVCPTKCSKCLERPSVAVGGICAACNHNSA